jgi:thiamine-monophosphate kinase
MFSDLRAMVTSVSTRRASARLSADPGAPTKRGVYSGPDGFQMPQSEKEMIRLIRRLAGTGSAVAVGIGDDAAVLRIPPGHEVLVTTDFSIENVHFRREWHRPEVVGWRCLTRGLSDIAAMGGEPRAVFLSLAVGGDVSQNWVARFLQGLMKLARCYKLPLAGGDTGQSEGGIQADIVVVGSIPKGKAVLRSGARPGDSIYVTGTLGAPALALDRLRLGLPLGAERSRHFRPEARVSLGQWLREHAIPSAMIDISDGLSTDLGHICDESHIGAVIDTNAIPLARAGKGQFVDLGHALHGGDEYELLFTSAEPVPSKIEGVRVTRIGRTTATRGMRLIDEKGQKRSLRPEGWEHFARSQKLE